MLATLLFYIFSFFTVAAGVMVISSKNPVHSVLFLIFAFFNAAGLFVLLGAEFLAMLLIIVYVGAVAVLFLFVVMMLNINFEQLRQGFIRYLPVGILAALVLLTQLVLVINAMEHTPSHIAQAVSPITEETHNTISLGNILYTDYIYPFQVAGVILLVAMIGAIVLTLRSRPGVRRQSITRQLDRKRHQGVELVKVKTGEGI